MNTILVRSRKGIALISLIISNLIPLFWILFFGGNVFVVLIAYWIESAIIGIFTISKMITVGQLHGLLQSVFFCFHYGMFMFVHAVFLFALFWDSFDDMSVLPIFAASLFISHGISFILYFVMGTDGKERKTVDQYFIQPYKRIFVMQITIIFGAWVVMLFGTPVFAAVLLVLGKIVLDSFAHIFEHRDD